MLRATLLLAFSRSVVGDGTTRITNASEFKGFVDNVNRGTNYSGTTVLLDSDLTLSERIDPVGKGTSNHFLGTFDGQGHIISNLTVNSSSEYAGLFCYSTGLAIRNVILDSSCSVTNSYNGANNALAGGIIGHCYADSGQCSISNSVNMADVTFSGKSDRYSFIGGISGWFHPNLNYPNHVKNCVNYGSVTHSGVSNGSDLGGIVGYMTGSYYEYVYNCFNYGTITHNGTTTTKLFVGGILGYSQYTYIENCVSAGEISTKNVPSYNCTGSIVGYVDWLTFINNCYVTSSLSAYEMYGTGPPTSSSHVLIYDNTTFELSETVSVGSYTGNSLIGALNAAADYYVLRDYSKWLLNKDSNNVINFIINSRTSPITMDSQVILLPSLASKESFIFKWYNDDEYTHLLESFEVTGATTLYGTFEENTNNYTITFDSRKEGVTVAPISARFGAAVSLPNDLTRDDGCGIAFWETEHGDNARPNFPMPARNITLHAVWKCANIATPEDFTDFSKVVNSGSDYFSGSTVLLDSDLSLSEEAFRPINSFLGTFDGQGHIISGLKMNTSSGYAGLFGFSTGLTIRNVVLDGSCSLANSFNSSSSLLTGGIIGYCYASRGQCIIENSVNMADVTSRGDNGYLYLGGVAGYLSATSSYPTYVKNCVNYGSVTYSGTSQYSYIGGVIGTLYSYTTASIYNHLYNSLNYGMIIHSGTTNILSIGGIVGYSCYASIENCVSAGKISTHNTPSDKRIGSIVGTDSSSTNISYCYYTSDVGVNSINGGGTSPSTTETSSSPTTVGLDLVSSLNNYASNNGWNKWLLNEKNVSISFVVNHGKNLVLSSQIILLPDLSADGVKRGFSGWYDSPFCNELFQGSSVTEAMTLYGLYGKMVSVAFDANGGRASEKSKNVLFNSPYGELPKAHRADYTFLGWFTEKANGTEVKNETIVADPDDHTLYAHWEKRSASIFIAAGVIAVFIAVVVIIAVLFVVLKKKDGNGSDSNSKKRTRDVELDICPREEYCRIVATTTEEKEAEVASGVSRGILTNLYPQGYERPSVGDALLAAGLTEEQTDFICDACGNAAPRALKGGKPTTKLTEEDAAALAMYTYDFGLSDFEHNPYRIINKSLVGRNYNSLQRASGLLYLVVSALRKLPRYTGKTLYRGVRGEVNLDKDHYRNGNVIVWSALSSTSPSMEATKAFLARGSKSGRAVGTLFIIDNGWGYNIQPYSLFPDEVEILLEPERQFEVTGVIEADGLTIINLQMLDTPLSIPEVFGEV